MPISALKVPFKDGEDSLRIGNSFHENVEVEPGRSVEPLWDSNCRGKLKLNRALSLLNKSKCKLILMLM